MGAFEDFMVLEMSRRSPHLTYEITSYDGNPNDGSAPAILQGAPKGTWFLQQTGDIWWRKRTSAADSWVIANINETYEATNIYVRAATGNDSNLGTSSSPLATLIEAEARIPLNVNHPVIIHVGPHTGSGYAVPRFRSRAMNANIYVQGDGGGGSTDGFTEIQASTSAGAGTSQSVVIASGLSTTEYGGMGEYFGKTIEILSGAAAGDRRSIRNNTATQIYPNVPFSAAVAEGDLYRIVEPETIIYSTTLFSEPFIDGFISYEEISLFQVELNSIWFINLKFDTSVSQYYIMPIGPGTVVMCGVVFNEEVQLEMSKSHLKAGYEKKEWPVEDLALPSTVTDLGLAREKQWAGWGIALDHPTSGGGTVHLDGAKLSGVINAESISASERGHCQLYAGSLWNDGGSNASIQMQGTQGTYCYVSPIVADILIGTPTSNGAIYSGFRGRIELAAFGSHAIILNSSGNCVVAEIGGTILMGIGGNVDITSTSGLGMMTGVDGKIDIFVAPPTVSAGGGDFSEDKGNTTRNISELVASGDVFINMAYGRIGIVEL